MLVEMAFHKIHDFLFGLRVKGLELVGSCELFNVDSVGSDVIRFSVQEFFAFFSGYAWYSGKYVSRGGGSTFHAVLVVDSAGAGGFVAVELKLRKNIQKRAWTPSKSSSKSKSKLSLLFRSLRKIVDAYREFRKQWKNEKNWKNEEKNVLFKNSHWK